MYEVIEDIENPKGLRNYLGGKRQVPGVVASRVRKRAHLQPSNKAHSSTESEGLL